MRPRRARGGRPLGLVVALAVAMPAGAGDAGAPIEARLTPEELHLATLLGIGDGLLFPGHAPAADDVPGQIAELRRHQRVVELLLDQAMSIDGVLGQLEREQSEVTSAADVMQGRRDARVSTLNILALVLGSVTGVIGTGLQFADTRSANAGNALIVAGGIGAAGIGVAALVQPPRGRPPHGTASNMLAPFFDRPSAPGSAYPEVVWRWLDAPLPGASTSIRATLVASWTEDGKVSDDPDGAERIDLLTSPIPEDRRVRVDVLKDRVGMLADVEGHVAEMNLVLRGLMSAVREGG